MPSVSIILIDLCLPSSLLNILFICRIYRIKRYKRFVEFPTEDLKCHLYKQLFPMPCITRTNDYVWAETPTWHCPLCKSDGFLCQGDKRLFLPPWSLHEAPNMYLYMMKSIKSVELLYPMHRTKLRSTRQRYLYHMRRAYVCSNPTSRHSLMDGYFVKWNAKESMFGIATLTTDHHMHFICQCIVYSTYLVISSYGKMFKFALLLGTY